MRMSFSAVVNPTHMPTDASKVGRAEWKIPGFDSVVVVVGWGHLFPHRLVINSTLNLGCSRKRKSLSEQGAPTGKSRGCRLGVPSSWTLESAPATHKDLEGTFVPNPSTHLVAVSGKHSRTPWIPLWSAQQTLRLV
ncbi:hypothetical protein BV898_16974 [Hypsibius exemplaris]|uniref:Uncharacterized protein n=1 Tax=Hypsibius exemplaris TaxID=2072580 RepID=A0A9X6RM52_HYPEX|nr:hypothetical protein BV898_16974 [Hypsibius exemplaris]